jgi:hypothetical protein
VFALARAFFRLVSAFHRSPLVLQSNLRASSSPKGGAQKSSASVAAFRPTRKWCTFRCTNRTNLLDDSGENSAIIPARPARFVHLKGPPPGTHFRRSLQIFHSI